MSDNDNHTLMKDHMSAATAHLLVNLGQYAEEADKRGEKFELIGALESYMPMVLLKFVWDAPPWLIAWMRTQEQRVKDVAKAMEENPEIDAFVDDALKANKFAPKGKRK